MAGAGLAGDPDGGIQTPMSRANYALARILRRAMDGMNLRYPPPSPGLGKIVIPDQEPRPFFRRVSRACSSSL